MTCAPMRIIFVLALILCLSPAAAPGEEFESVSKPSADITLSFVRPGRIADVACKEGDTVKKGKLLAKQEDKAEQIQLEMLAVQAADETKIKLAEAELAQKRKDLARLENAGQTNAATSWEIEHSRLEVRTAELNLEKARVDHEQDRRRHQESGAQLSLLHLLSPINGQVEEVKIEEGESVQGLDPVIRVVQTDPLQIDVPVPVSLANQLRRNQPARVTFPAMPGQKKADQVEGRVENISTVAEAASNTLWVRINAANSLKRPVGERVSITFLNVGEGKKPASPSPGR